MVTEKGYQKGYEGKPGIGGMGSASPAPQDPSDRKRFRDVFPPKKLKPKEK